MKTLVNIFDAQEPLAAYLFLKQYYEEGDRLLFISTREDKNAVAPYAALFHIPDGMIDYVWFKRSQDSYIYERICRRLRSWLSTEVTYWVNLAGGTRYSALAVQHVFAGFGAKFFYVQTRENVIVSSFFDDSIHDDDDVVEPIRYRMSLAEYFELNGLRHDLRDRSHKPMRSAEDAQRIFDCFKRRRMSHRAFSAIDQLRTQYRGMRRAMNIHDMMFGSPHRHDAIPGLRELMNEFGFVPANPEELTPKEVDYLTGGWFEEYVYYILLAMVRPQQIALSVRIARPGSLHNNELDVVFIKANTLFVVECKTGVATDHMFNDIVYKVCALKEAFLGMACKSYIFTLKNDYDHRLSHVSEMMGVRLCAKGTLVSEAKMEEVAAEMRRISHEEDI
jgi:hypothetical protein